jgi:hypothetical protein
VGDSAQKEGVMIAGGDTTFIDAGALIPLEDLIEQYAPNVKAHFAEWWEDMKSPDGRIYYLISWQVFHGNDWNPNDGNGIVDPATHEYKIANRRLKLSNNESLTLRKIPYRWC